MERSANTKPAATATEDEEDIAALIYQESQRRKAEAAALAGLLAKTRRNHLHQRMSRSGSPMPTTSHSGKIIHLLPRPRLQKPTLH